MRSKVTTLGIISFNEVDIKKEKGILIDDRRMESVGSLRR